jgi:peptide/nickel transport system permease protein
VNARTLLALLLLGALVVLIIVGLFAAPYDPLDIDLGARLQQPSAAHWLGTDEFGRDVLSRAAVGAGISSLVALLTVAISVALGAALGIASGFLRGAFDRLLMMANDALLAFPGILLALAIMVVVGAGVGGLVVALSLAYLPSVVRVVRSTVLSIREREYVEASHVAGNGALYTMARHVLPNAIGPIAVLATSMFGWVLLSESALSFLGVGITPPAPTWGNMLSSARPYLDTAPWLGIIPGCLIALTLLGITLAGDALRDHLDPKALR